MEAGRGDGGPKKGDWYRSPGRVGGAAAARVVSWRHCAKVRQEAKF